ncbi:MAG: hypothetical protein HKN58_07425 [Xanthomonadales bacterium]|nr:hypothetical protein [Xanthomonadales bacterium]
MLERLQQQLHDINRSDAGYDIRHFLVTDARVAKALSGGNDLTHGGETLLLQEDEDGLALSLYLDEAILDRLDADDPAAALKSGLLDELCKVIEGLSHFNYVAWRATRDRSVTLLELELQAEVDKFVSTMLMALGARDAELSNALHNRLFGAVRFHDHLSPRQLERYRTASDFAARFCRRLAPRLKQRSTRVWPELRRFYRMSLGEKISHIHASA